MADRCYVKEPGKGSITSQAGQQGPGVRRCEKLYQPINRPYNYFVFSINRGTNTTGLKDTYVSSLEAATVLAIHPMAIQKLLKAGKLRGEKIANRWLIRRADLGEFAKTYEPKVGRPRTKRKYTRRKQV